MGWLKDMTGTYEAGLRILAGAAFLSGALVMLVKRRAEDQEIDAAGASALQKVE
jgi:LPXTG-motif cell wall-anchored protein